MARRERRLENVVSLGMSAFMALASVYFFLNSLSLMTRSEPLVAASLLSAVIGMALLSASVTLLRTWVVTRVYRAEGREEQG